MTISLDKVNEVNNRFPQANIPSSTNDERYIKAAAVVDKHGSKFREICPIHKTYTIKEKQILEIPGDVLANTLKAQNIKNVVKK